MAGQGLDGPTPIRAAVDQRQVTRRVLLQALGLGAAAAVASTGSPAIGRSAAAQESPAPPASTVGTRESGGPRLEDELWDLEFDTERIFRFVADEVAYEAYTGALRGVNGTRWGLAGNSVDQALLLAELLTQAQVPIRFAVGELDDETANELLDSMRVDASTARAQIERIDAGAQVALDQHPGLTPEQRTALRSPDALRQRLIERAGTRLEEGLATIESALAAESISLPTPELDLPDRERTQHVWVQYADGSLWVDLDPTVPDAAPGKAYANQTATWDVLPDEVYHRVRFRAILEKNSSGEAVREESFVHEARAVDLVGVPVVFAHVDPNALKAIGVSILGFIEGTKQYVPSLLAGEAGQTGTPLTLGAGEGALDILGSTESDGEAIAEWLEIEILPPDGPSRTYTREVFDRVGIDRRAAGDFDLASLPPVEMTDVPELGQRFLPLESVWLVGVVGGRVPASYFAQDYAVEDIEADVALLVHGYHSARDWLQVEIAADRGYRWYHDEPNLTAAIVSLVEIAAGEYRISASLDVIHQGYGVVPFAGATPSVQPLVLAGVLAHVAERTGADTAAELAPDAPPPAGSVAQVFEQAAREGLAIQTITPEHLDLANLSISDVAKVRITAAVAAGYVVVVPERAVALDGTAQVGWWQVDPATGRTFDLMETGRGGSPMGEDTVILVGGPAWRAAEAFRLFALGVTFGIAVAAAIMTYMSYPN